MSVRYAQARGPFVAQVIALALLLVFSTQAIVRPNSPEDGT